MRRWHTGVFARGLLVGSLAGALAVSAHPQQQPEPDADAPQAQQGQGAAIGPHSRYAGMGRVAGEVTAVAGATLTVKTEDGSSMQVVTTDNTRVMKDRGPVKVSDLHPGDGLMAMGNLDPATHTLHAAMVMAEDAAQVKAMRDNLGKTYITGRVTAIDLDNAKMTVERPDHVAQTIGFDETTSFKRAVRGERPAGGYSTGAGGNGGAAGPGGTAGSGAAGGPRGGGGYGGGMAMGANSAALDRAFANGESITLADIKVGDNVVGSGALKAGVFVPVHLLDSPPRQHRPGTGGAPAATGAAGTQPSAGAGPGAR